MAVSGAVLRIILRIILGTILRIILRIISGAVLGAILHIVSAAVAGRIVVHITVILCHDTYLLMFSRFYRFFIATGIVWFIFSNFIHNRLIFLFLYIIINMRKNRFP